MPLVLTPTSSVTDADYSGRNTVAEVYTQAIDDLTKAEAVARDANRYAQWRRAWYREPLPKEPQPATLARIYLQQQNFAAARDAANRVITSGTFSLLPNFADVFNDATKGPEIIFKIIVTDQDGANDLNTFYASALNQGRGDVRVQTKFRQIYAAADDARHILQHRWQNTFTSKFNDRYGDVPVVRLAEMYLVRAEANLRLGTSIGATPLADVNLIRSRANNSYAPSHG